MQAPILLPLSTFWQEDPISIDESFKQCNKCHRHNTKWCDVLMMDTRSTMGATIMNLYFGTNILVAKKSVCMQTNAGSKVTLKADIAGFGTVYYDPVQVANIFSFAHLADKFFVT